ncbi:biofilm regulation diguanylate cyclase SiaD [Modicisalibacter radicis]|uniref:biofilm regulation diguanylate cyclase SiaD n=1 Tax=Halomonas sp. EAR18 TaxID=2518972 RepID=UPI00109D73DF|nr:biofilm regulation diguanylate cyclase SiaD [Halomonas sp. EAR18]
MSADDASLYAYIESLLEADAYREHPLYPALEQLYRSHCGQRKRLERLLSIADGYQQFTRDEMREVQQQYERQLRRERKLSRISDHYQELMRESNRELHAASTLDPLTGLANRRKIAEYLKQAACRAHHDAATFSVVMVDVDHFKSINDKYGHETGDRILIELAAIMRQALRTRDLCGRWGGEEFLLLLHDCSLAQARQLVDRLLARIREPRFTAGEEALALTVSAGIAEYRLDESYQNTVNRADLALFQAKRDGRDCYRVPV